MGALSGEVIARSLQQVGSMVLFMIVSIAILEVVLYLILSKLLKSKYTLPYLLLAPAAVGLCLLVIYPIGYEVRLAFTNMSLRHFRDYTFSLAQGWRNLKFLFTEPGLKQVMFFPVLWHTILWTVINVVFHVAGGMGLALLLNRPLRGRGLYRTLLVFPWAIPQIIAVLACVESFTLSMGLST